MFFDKMYLMNFYITTPIYYSNDIPHLGHLATTVFADIVAGYHRTVGDSVLFLTGVDEHGEKISETAKKAGKDPQIFVDDMALRWMGYWKSLNIQNDIFMRTSNPQHKDIAKKLLEKIKERGDIYKSVYKGSYCTGCEEFKQERELVNGICPEHRVDQVSYREEENYFFKLSKYIPQLRELITEGVIKIIPENKKNEMLARLNDDVLDLSVSRQKVSWGIQLPWDNSQTIYVWVEALMNYYSATRIYGKENFWPASVHFLGKGNNWFHSVIWPALLLSLNIPLPKEIFVHGYYNVEGVKMSKSLGNVISPDSLTSTFGVDGTRYLLCASQPYLDDFSVSTKWFKETYNNDLANGLGNLVSRVSKMCADAGLSGLIDNTVFGVLERNMGVKKAYEDYRLFEVVSIAKNKIKAVNEYINQNEPWKKEGSAQMEILHFATREIQDIAFILMPIMPDICNKIMATTASAKIVASEVLFKRLV
jgi:methionyl-tRNA synthetase